MTPIRRRNKVIPVLSASLLCIFLSVILLFNPSVVKNIGDMLNENSSTPPPVATPFPYPAYAAPLEVDIIVDSPPNEDVHFAHAVLKEISSAISSRCHANAGELLLFSHFMTSRSYDVDAVSFKVSKLANFPPQPVKQYSTDGFKQVELDQTYTKEYAAWEQTIAQQKQQIARTCATVSEETHSLATLAIPYDNSGAALYAALLETSLHLHPVTHMRKLLIIISSLVNTSSYQDTGPFTLPGVEVLFLRTCIQPTPAQCQQTVAFWSQFLLRIGVIKITDADPEQSSQAIQNTL